MYECEKNMPLNSSLNHVQLYVTNTQARLNCQYTAWSIEVKWSSEIGPQFGILMRLNHKYAGSTHLSHPKSNSLIEPTQKPRKWTHGSVLLSWLLKPAVYLI